MCRVEAGRGGEAEGEGAALCMYAIRGCKPSRVYVANRADADQARALVATRAIVVSYYWHFVDVVWIALFFMIYLLK